MKSCDGDFVNLGTIEKKNDSSTLYIFNGFYFIRSRFPPLSTQVIEACVTVHNDTHPNHTQCIKTLSVCSKRIRVCKHFSLIVLLAKRNYSIVMHLYSLQFNALLECKRFVFLHFNCEFYILLTVYGNRCNQDRKLLFLFLSKI